MEFRNSLTAFLSCSFPNIRQILTRLKNFGLILKTGLDYISSTLTVFGMGWLKLLAFVSYSFSNIPKNLLLSMCGRDWIIDMF